MTEANALNAATTGIVGNTGTSFTATAVTQYDVIVGGATSSTLASVGPGSSGQVLQSGGNAANPAYSTATYPATATSTGTILRADGTNWSATTSTYPNTNAVSTLLYASSANVMSALATANNGALITSNTGMPSILAETATAGIPLVSGGTGVPPAWTTAVVGGGGTGLTTTTAYGLITGGTTATGNFQNAGTGSSGQVYISGGSAALGTWTTVTPSVTVYTSGTGTYTTPAGTLYLIVEMVGGGGGGAASGTSPGAATAGNNSTFGTSLLTCNGGAAGLVNGTQAAGGTATGGDINLTGGASGEAIGAVQTSGGLGGCSFYGGFGQAGVTGGGPGLPASVNSGSGGGGAGSAAGALTGGGGGAGGYLRKLISSPAGTYSYAVGGTAAGGTLGTGGAAGGVGAAGNIIITAYFV